MNIHCTVAYLAGQYDRENPAYEGHMSALAFVKALKGEAFKTSRRLAGRVMSPGDQESALLVFAEWAANHLRPVAAPVHFIPVPGSKIDLKIPAGKALSTAHLMAYAAVGLFPGVATVADVLRFSAAHPSAHREGNADARNVDWLIEELRVIGTVPKGGTVVLIDDVYTSGAHMMACLATLRKAGLAAEPIALCAARTVKAYVDRPFPYAEVLTLA